MFTILCTSLSLNFLVLTTIYILSQCLTTFLKQKKSYFCKVKLNMLNQLWSSDLYFHTFATKTHSNISSVLLLSEWMAYPIDSVSKENNIVNLSNKILITEQTIIVNKGLSFCPSKTKIDEIKFCKDNKESIRKVRLMEYHQYSDKHPTKETPFMKQQSSNWTPPSGRNVHVDSFVDTARKHCNNSLINNHPTKISNIHNNEKHSLNEHAKDNSVTIKEADKGGVIVLFNTLDYINSCENRLSDTTNYKKIQPKTLKEFMSEANNLISNLHGTCAVFLINTLPDQLKTAVFYGIPKTSCNKCLNGEGNYIGETSTKFRF